MNKQVIINVKKAVKLQREALNKFRKMNAPVGTAIGIADNLKEVMNYLQNITALAREEEI